MVADTDGDGMMDGDEVYQSFDPTDPTSKYVEPQDYGFLEIHVFPADYTFGDEPIARTNTTSWNSGAYTIDLPVGSYKIKAYSHQSTYKSEFHSDALTWEAATPVTITANAIQTIDFELGTAPSGTITGLLKDISDATADIGWPEITLHDPTDEDVVYWPGQFDRDWNELTQSHNDTYTMVAPTGSYKVKIKFWDGSYISSYYKDNGDGTYGTTSFDDADTISITESPLVDINFDLAGAPTGIIKGKVVDKDTGVFSGDWYSVILRGANVEWGEWTHLNVQIDESTKEYTAKAPEGTWKVMAESWPNYPESFFTGADSDSSASWSDGATITVIVDQTLENINFRLAYQANKSFDYGGTGTISGTVKTSTKEQGIRD